MLYRVHLATSRNRAESLVAIAQVSVQTCTSNTHLITAMTPLKLKIYLIPVNIRKKEADLHSGQVQRKVACNLVNLKKMLTYNMGDLDDS